MENTNFIPMIIPCNAVPTMNNDTRCNNSENTCQTPAKLEILPVNLERSEENDTFNYYNKDLIGQPITAPKMMAAKMPSKAQLGALIGFIPIVVDGVKQTLVGIFDIRDLISERWQSNNNSEAKLCAMVLPDEVSEEILKNTRCYANA